MLGIAAPYGLLPRAAGDHGAIDRNLTRTKCESETFHNKVILQYGWIDSWRTLLRAWGKVSFRWRLSSWTSVNRI